MQRERVQDQYPWTWEIPLAVMCAVLVTAVVSCQLGRSVANWAAGAGWLWPAPDKLITSVPGVLAGDATAGLPGIHHAATAFAVRGWLALIGLLAVLALATAACWACRTLGPARMRGMATVAEAHELLGRDRLWKVRHVVRPDLYPVRRVDR